MQQKDKGDAKASPKFLYEAPRQVAPRSLEDQKQILTAEIAEFAEKKKLLKSSAISACSAVKCF